MTPGCSFFYNALARFPGSKDTRVLHRPLIALAAALSIPCVALVAYADTQFRDIPAGHWAKRPATLLADRNIMPGRTPVDFAGDATLTRYELANILNALFTAGGPPSTFIVLSDMQPGHPETLEVQRVLGYSLMEMRKPGYFQGDAPVTRKELVTALDLLMQKQGVSPPARKTAVIFSDVKPTTPLGETLDRIVNRFGLFDAKAFTPFYPNSAIPRYSVLAMLVRALPYLNPALAAELREPVPTAPPASHAPGVTPSPAPTGAPTAAPSAAPGASPTPAPAAGGVQTWPNPAILTTRGWAAAEPVLLFSEDVPTESGLVAANEQRSYNGNMLFGGGATGEFWNGQLGGLVQLGSYYLPLTIASQNVDLLDTFIQAGGLYKIAGGPDWEAALGGAGMYRFTYNMNATLLSRYYMTADKTYFGAGPAASFGYRMSPELSLTGTALVYPFLQQSYNLSTNPKDISRWGADLTVRGEYALGPTLFATGAGHTFLSGGYNSGMQTYVGVELGVGSKF